METRGVQRLRCAVKTYDWGRSGPDSAVFKLFEKNCGEEGGIEARDDRPYAEFWMGGHVSGPSVLVEDGVYGLSLGEWIQRNSGVVGDEVARKWGANLPFLFKVLSVAKALSIQAHPDKELARILHKTRPDIFKDDNHKPEMALALTEFEALYGFVSLKELKDVLQNVPEVTDVVGRAYARQVLISYDEHGEVKVKVSLQSLFTQLMSASKEKISIALSKLKARLSLAREVRQLTAKEQLVLRLEKQYPADVGVLAAFIFNHVKLNPGEALCIGANELHAYLSGECIECMATSDNVVRAGLTPKERDIKILCSMLTYEQGFPKILQGISISPYIKRYTPPFDEFEVDRCIVPKGESAVFPASLGPSIFVVMEGDGTMRASFPLPDDFIREGDVMFVAANTEISVTTKSEVLHVYRAAVNNNFFKDYQVGM